MKDKKIIARTTIDEDELNELKRVTEAETNKEALAKAVKHYIKCSHTKCSKKKRSRNKKKIPVRKPVYLTYVEDNSD